MKDMSEEEIAKFDWLTLRKDMDRATPVETQKEKLFRKFKENPFVPIGCLATTMALGYGLWCFRTGQQRMSQYMMRTRIAAQGFTIAAMLVGIIIAARKGVNSTKAE